MNTITRLQWLRILASGPERARVALAVALAKKGRPSRGWSAASEDYGVKVPSCR